MAIIKSNIYVSAKKKSRNMNKSQKNKFYLNGGLNCNLVNEQSECIRRKPECLWNFTRKICLDNQNYSEQDVDPQISSQPKKENIISEKFKTTFYISPQLERLSTQLGINNNMRQTIDPEISNEELDILLNNIKIESNKKDTLMVIVDHIIHEKDITDANELLNIKIKVLLDNLAKKLCRCTEKIDESEKERPSQKKISSEAVCRSNIFHRRGIDYITHDCGSGDLNVLRYNYKMGPLLRPTLNSNSNILLRRHIPKRK